MHPVSDKLIAWYKQHKRDLPWRNTADPYRVWLSEIMLQQTQVAQGLSYYLTFTETFPTIIDLAKAPEDKVMRLWQGLGYYSRARNLHAAAKEVAANYTGKFPATYDAIKSLKGVGDYTAAAISSIAFNLPYAVVDGNVYRVLARLYNLHTPVNSGAGKKEFQLLADELLNKKHPGLHNSAMMEFGALWCKPQNPKCDTCPVQEHCLAFANNTVAGLPVKDKKTKVRDRYFHYFIFNYRDFVYIQKRVANDIWQNLYEFYLIETAGAQSPEMLLQHKSIKALAKKIKVLSVVPVKKHILSHQHIYATFYELRIDAPLTDKTLQKIKRSALDDFGIPQLLTKYLSLL
jgi:A/G-specific adenine glycosylase